VRRRGPVSLATKLKLTARPRQLAGESTSVQPLWGMRELQVYFQKKRTATDEFLQKNPDFPKVKIGGEWRFDPESVRAWFLRKQVTQVMQNEEKTG